MVGMQTLSTWEAQVRELVSREIPMVVDYPECLSATLVSVAGDGIVSVFGAVGPLQHVPSQRFNWKTDTPEMAAASIIAALRRAFG